MVPLTIKGLAAAIAFGPYQFQGLYGYPRLEVIEVGVIALDGNSLHVYHTETGEVLHPTQAPPRYSTRQYYNNTPPCITPSEDNWQTSEDTLQKDSKGKHRMWVPAEWRTDWDPAEWHHNATTQLSYLGDIGFVLIKF